MNDLHIENHMVLGDYYTDGKVARSERLDDLIRDAEFLRSWDWLEWVEDEGLTRELITDLVAAIKISDPKEAITEARAVFSGYVEDFAEAELEAEQ